MSVTHMLAHIHEPGPPEWRVEAIWRQWTTFESRPVSESFTGEYFATNVFKIFVCLHYLRMYGKNKICGRDKLIIKWVQRGNLRFKMGEILLANISPWRAESRAPRVVTTGH